jgi:hypothetical protein
MENNIIALVVIVIVACLLWWANETINRVPALKPLVAVAIVVISVLMSIRPLIAIIHGAM